MKCRVRIPGAVMAVAIALVSSLHAEAALNPAVQPCRVAVAKYSGKFVAKRMKAFQKCREIDFRSAGACTPAILAPKIAALEQKLRDGIASRCGSLSTVFLGAGFLDFPGKCADTNPVDGFTLTDLQDCMVTSHGDAVDTLIDVEYRTAPADAVAERCQKGIGKNAAKFVGAKLKAVQRCRTYVDRGKIAIAGSTCATADAKTAALIAKAASKARAGIVKVCTAAEVDALDTCSGPACAPFCATCDPNCVADCVLATHGTQVDDPSVAFSDLIDFEYATPPACGDGMINHLDEECENADAACPGQCGAPTSWFPCLCLTKPRQRVIEHVTGDLDNGWRGDSHDAAVVEGGGYVVDLYDCDGPAGPDTLCTVGPSCSVAPNPPCSNDAQCSLVGLGTCRKERTAVGPHCHLDVQQTCGGNGDCPGVGNFCVQQFHGPPLPLAAGGVSVCAVNVFTDDVVGTTDLVTGSTATRIRQDTVTFLGPTQSQPCPVCGGFCSAPPNDYDGRHNCTTNADCLDVAGSTCVTAPICSFGPNTDQPCRPTPPFGGSTSTFGNPSVDCLPFPPDISGGGLEILSDPSTTGTVTLAPSVQCNDPAFSGKTCAGGGANGADCTDDSECPGGTCSFQCFCPNGGAVQQRPNGCDAACVGGASDASYCTDDTDCPGGFCHLADCRPDLTAPPQLQPHEGSCTTTVEGHCSQSVSRTCSADPDCNPPNCPTCTPGETCLTVAKNCFLNSGITRVGVPSTTDPVYVSVFCIGSVASGSVNAAAGLPGPGTIRQPTTTIKTGF